jgi:hypothetical protein
MTTLNFLNLNRVCPICNEPLQIYMQWLDSILFKCEQIDNNTYKFLPFKGKLNGIEAKQIEDGEVYLNDNKIHMSAQLFREGLKYSTYFFYMCNQKAFKDNYNSYDISAFKACYYRSSVFFDLEKNDNKEWIIKESSKDMNDSIKLESFSFSNKINDINKVYILKLDYESKETILWHYSFSEKDSEKPYFKPNLFEKKLPLLNVRPSVGINDRENLLDRFESWIIMS